VLIGHNQDLAWGLTTAMADTQDLFLERVAPGGNSVLRPDGRQEPIRFRREHIRVRGREHALIHRVAWTSNGVLLDGILGHQTGTRLDLTDPQTPLRLALRWSIELPDRAIDGLYRLNAASTLDEARRAARMFRHASQNFLLAHRDGGIAWQVSGSLPRRKGASGAFPQPGWTGTHGWSGYWPEEDNPGREAPESGLLASANNRSLDPERAGRIGHYWMPAYRVTRIRELLDDHPAPTAETLTSMQQDRVSLEARSLLGRLRTLAGEIRREDAAAGEIADFLLGWDGDCRGDSAPAALFVRLRPALYRELFGDELGEDLSAYMGIALESYNGLHQVADSGFSSFWDDVRTPDIETPAQVFARALRRAWRELETTQGDPRSARLDRLRALVFPHAFHDVAGLGWLFDLGPFGVGGDDHTLNVMKATLEAPATPAFVPSYRVVFTPGDWGETRGSNTLGQSGHRFSPYRADQLRDWLEGGYHPWPWNGFPADRRIGRLRLHPG
jgi:acyl-homoserine lactone acylase PvdQ